LRLVPEPFGPWEGRATVKINYIDEIRTLARQFRPNERNLTLYFPDFEAPPVPQSLNRVFGPPVGVTDELWPTYPRLRELLSPDSLAGWDPRDVRMEHVFTIDLDGLHLFGVPPGARAMMLFLSNATYHRAFHWGNADSAVVFLGEDDLARGPYQGPLPHRSLRRWSRRFALAAVDVPGDVFDAEAQEDARIVALHDAIWQAPARLGGRPIWVRDDQAIRTPSGQWRNVDTTPRFPLGMPSSPDFLMQFERRFAEVNLGNQGVMYVTGQSACYQSF
jgi:hypothetical protein